MSALPPNADIGTQPPDVCFVPKADMAAISLAIFAAIRPAPFWSAAWPVIAVPGLALCGCFKGPEGARPLDILNMRRQGFWGAKLPGALRWRPRRSEQERLGIRRQSEAYETIGGHRVRRTGPHRPRRDPQQHNRYRGCAAFAPCDPQRGASGNLFLDRRAGARTPVRGPSVGVPQRTYFAAARRARRRGPVHRSRKYFLSRLNYRPTPHRAAARKRPAGRDGPGRNPAPGNPGRFRQSRAVSPASA
jgi:hypothetical protein